MVKMLLWPFGSGQAVGFVIFDFGLWRFLPEPRGRRGFLRAKEVPKAVSPALTPVMI